MPGNDDAARRRPGLALLGGVLGPASFVTGWVVGGFRAEGYSAVDDPISRLAADGAPTRPLMTAGFVAFGAGVALHAALAERPAAARVAMATAAVATVGVALTPLDSGVDGLHSACAGVAYAAMAAVPWASAPDRRLARAASLAIGAALLASTMPDPPTGLFQRLGLTMGDVWIAASAVAAWRRARQP